MILDASASWPSATPQRLANIQTADDFVDHLLRVQLAQRCLAVDAHVQLRPGFDELGRAVGECTATHRELAFRRDRQGLGVAVVHREFDELLRRFDIGVVAVMPK